MTGDSWGLSLHGMITAFESPNNEKCVVVVSPLPELFDGPAVVLPHECPPPFLFLPRKFVYAFLCLRNTTYMKPLSLQDFREERLNHGACICSR